MNTNKVHCPTWVIFEEKFAICIRQVLRPLQIASPKTVDEILDKVMPKLSDRLRIVRPEAVKEEVLRQILDMGLLHNSTDEAQAKELIEEIRKSY